MSGWRLVDVADDSPTGVAVELDGSRVTLPPGHSLLAGLLSRVAAAGGVEFFCAIGQCQRCVVRVNGREEVACMVCPAAGDVIETPASWGGGRRRDASDQKRP